MNYLVKYSLGTHSDDHVLHRFLSYNLSLPLLMLVTTLIMPTNDSPALRNFTFGISKLASYMPNAGSSKNYQFHGVV